MEQKDDNKRFTDVVLEIDKSLEQVLSSSLHTRTRVNALPEQRGRVNALADLSLAIAHVENISKLLDELVEVFAHEWIGALKTGAENADDVLSTINRD